MSTQPTATQIDWQKIIDWLKANWWIVLIVVIVLLLLMRRRGRRIVIE
jgi:uncharacterized protein involved in exopolysaccharide biosynthesis